MINLKITFLIIGSLFISTVSSAAVSNVDCQMNLQEGEYKGKLTKLIKGGDIRNNTKNTYTKYIFTGIDPSGKYVNDCIDIDNVVNFVNLKDEMKDAYLSSSLIKILVSHEKRIYEISK